MTVQTRSGAGACATICVVAGGSTVDLGVTFGPETTVGQLAIELARQCPGNWADGLWIEGSRFENDRCLVDTPLTDGAVVSATQPSPDPPAVGQIVAVSGWDAGRQVRLQAGSYPGGTVIGERVNADENGLRVGDSPSLPYGSTFAEGKTAWRYEPIPPRASPPGDAFNRPPRQLPPLCPNPPPLPKRESAVRTGNVLRWTMIVGPLIMGAAMILIFKRPSFAIFMALGPLMAIMNWIDGKWRGKRTDRIADLAYRAAMGSSVKKYRAWLATSQTVSNIQQPDLATVLSWPALRHHRLWERRPHHGDFGMTLAGYAPFRSYLPNRRHTGSTGCRDPYEAAPRRHLAYRRLPRSRPGDRHRRSWARDGRTGQEPHRSTGYPPGASRRQAPCLCIAIASDRLDVDIAPPPRSRRRRRATSPGHCRSGRGTTGGRTGCPRPRSPIRTALLRGGARVRRATGNGHSHRRPLDTASGSGRPARQPRYRQSRSSIRRRTGPLTGTGVYPATDVCSAAARTLMSIADPELGAGDGTLPPAVELFDLLGFQDLKASQVIERWNDEPDVIAAPIGLCASGVVNIDIVKDGPHGLLAGTTGAGKSELLRTLVASLAATVSPEHLNFVLIDYKGGSAFDACADLPHVVGVVTDLDEHLAARAMTCLEAELGHREHLLRSAGVSDLAGYLSLTGQSPLPRLYLVVDEFAAMAADLPEFMDALVDIAARGRSLGVHLMLATQRPAGIIKDAIRANTNLRIALRVQTTADSRDVLDDGAAALLSRSTPGRGYVRFGPSDLTGFQTALVTGRSSDLSANRDSISTPSAYPV